MQYIIELDKKVTIGIIIAEVAVLFLLIFFLIRMLKKRKDTKNLHMEGQWKKRDDWLNRNLRNERASEKVRNEAEKNIPYQVHYHDEVKGGTNKCCIQIIEHGRLSTRKYILNVDTILTIGGDKDNDVIISEEKATRQDVQIIRQNNSIYIKKGSPSSRAVLERGKRKQIIEENAIAVNDGDVVVIGDTKMEIRFVK